MHLSYYVDRGYRGHGESESEVYISGQRRGVTTRRLKRCLKRRQAIEPIIGHLKNDGLLGRNYLKGELGDQMNILLCCAGHNLRLVLRRLRFFSRFFTAIFAVDGVLAGLKLAIQSSQFRYAVVKDRISSFLPASIASNYGVNQIIQDRLITYHLLKKMGNMKYAIVSAFILQCTIRNAEFFGSQFKLTTILQR